MQATFRMASLEDMEQLVRARFDFFAAEKWTLSAEQQEVIEKSLRRYYGKYLNSDFFAVFVEEEQQSAAVAFLSIAEKPAGISFPTGKTATVFNVLTYPQYRRKGYATKAMKMLIEEAKKREVSYIELLATRDGRPLYQKLGFEELQLSGFTEMKLSLV